MLFGYPGSGKTYFSEQLAKEISAVRINADAMRVAALGTLSAAKEFDKTTGLLNPIIFGALDYTTVQVLKSGNSIICDYQHKKRSVREKSQRLAKENGAIAVIIWVRTPEDIAIRRGNEREENLDQRQHSIEKMESLIDEHAKLIEMPDKNEKVIVIDGTLEFNNQYSSFAQQLATL